MNIKIGTVIKKLRLENNITQDNLANAIGVTPQAISRWESEGGYPDIELLPAIADFFSVSTDELLGYKLSEKEKNISEIKKEMSRLSEVGTIEEQITFARNAILRYPSDCEIKQTLASCLYNSWQDTHDKDTLSEIESLCSSVIAKCNNKNTQYDSIFILINIYKDTHQCDKAMAALNMLTPIKYCRETAKSCGIGDGNTELYIQDEIGKLTDLLGIAITHYALNDELPNDSSTWDKKIEILNISNQLYKMIYGENLMFYHTRISRNYWLISTYQISQGKGEEALVSLEKMCYHAVEYDKSYINNHGKFFSSILTDKLKYPEQSQDFHEFKEHTCCYYMLDKLQNKCYNCIRQDKRFILIINNLNQYAK